jgi:drug/metabolite transporter (DMT)-like permease
MTWNKLTISNFRRFGALGARMLLLSEIVVAVVASVAVLQKPITVFSSVGALFVVLAIVLKLKYTKP